LPAGGGVLSLLIGAAVTVLVEPERSCLVKLMDKTNLMHQQLSRRRFRTPLRIRPEVPRLSERIH